MSAVGSTHIGRSGVPSRAPRVKYGPRPTTLEAVLRYVPTEYGWQDVYWQGERIGSVKRFGAKWRVVTASGSYEGDFGARRAAGAHLRRIIEGRRSA